MNVDCLLEFVKYVDGQILPATADVANLHDRNRKHVQKLVYTNLVDRFDAMVDGAILDNGRIDYLVDQATASLDQQITEAELLKLLMRSGDIQSAIDEKLRIALRNTVLRNRHSRKLASLFRAFDVAFDYWSKPRVNINTGRIIESMTPYSRTIPHSICGYADWLYCRRNSIVHGAGTIEFLANDRAQLRKLFSCEPAQRVIIRLASVAVAAAFYKDVVASLLEAAG